MKKTQLLIMISISLLLFYGLSFSVVTQGSTDMDFVLQTFERLKEEGDFDNWPCKNGPIRVGIILSKDDFGSLQEAEEDDVPIIRIMDDFEGILATKYSYSWTVNEKGKVRIRINVMQTCLQAQEFLIWRFAFSNMANVHLPPRGEAYGINAGDISFVSGDRINFVRNNIHAEIYAYDEMATEIKAIAEDLDQLLLTRPTGEDALELMPVINGIQASERSIKTNEETYLTVDAEFPEGNPVNLDPIQGDDTFIATDDILSNEDFIFMWKTTEGDVYIDGPVQYYYSSGKEGFHTISFLLTNIDTGIITEAQISIEVDDDRKIDERFWDFLLTADEVPGYRLEKIYRSNCCLISPDGLGYVVHQEWASINEDIGINIMMEIFDSEETAICGMKIHMDTADPWIWGSVYGGILGNYSWRSGNDNHAVIFSYGNIGIRMSTNKYYQGESTLRINQEAITDLAESQIKKIDQNLAPEIIDYREYLRETRLSAVEYDRYMAEAVNINLNGYELITNEDSLWLLKDEGVRMGIRREWQNSQGKVTGVDICKLESNTMAEDTASERKKKWMYIEYFEQQSSKIIVHDNAVIHTYYLNHEYNALPMPSPPDNPKSSPESSYRNPIYYDRLGLPFPYYNHSYYNPGSYFGRFPATPNSNTSLRYPYNDNFNQPGSSSYVWNSLVPFYKTSGYNYPAYYPERYAFPVNSKDPYEEYIFSYRYNSPLYSYSSPNPYPALPSEIFDLLASSNLNKALQGIELINNYWPLF